MMTRVFALQRKLQDAAFAALAESCCIAKGDYS
jgi:hypothetical protein